MPRETVYIGEALPVEVRVYWDERARVQPQELPEITGEGCTIENVPNRPDESDVTRNGREYHMLTFKTAITAVTTGKITLGPVSEVSLAQLPQQHHRHGGFFDDPFSDPMFDQMMSPTQQITIRGDPVVLTAKPLPAEGQPASFAGAVGTFTMTTTAKPAMVEAGDPVTITAKIEGRGNFDRVTAPEILDADGWKTYPPSAKFEKDDDVGISGAKSFDIAAIPQTNKTETPRLEWSYFDPGAEKYVTLTGEPTPIKVEGALDQQQPAAVTAQAAPQPVVQTPAKPDISYIRADSTGWGRTFQPLYTNPIFWTAQGAPLLALLAFAGIEVARKRAADAEARRRAQWRREKDAALAAMNRRDLPESELYQTAARVLRLDAAIQTGRDPNTLDGGEVAGARELDEDTAQRVRRLFDLQAEALYAGISGGRSTASAQSRSDMLETVKGYENAKPVS